ncbi:non-ribosomal peptide synthetase [Pseudoalteromonas sp. OOF1S-7]|uniref:non-ribosomal peptide synthetase n=1 Tax=Pseudoalteromonas sp. OOF1S-7 TaxID=2917757 RepID=UPI001EF4E579|nr:non-ribosomal peptide synthetase [Pseudoalteromonas sp. OOF1S-7]MCG7534497.1 amino acid adenylation domain-containing protein [Pseudoalteromonas sp. OOF1S-7]
MKAEHLFDRLSQSGILVTLDTGKLVVKAAKGAMTPDFAAQIKQHKAALMAFLEKQSSYQSAPNYPAIQPVERTPENLYPVSFNQQRLWFIHQISGNSANYNIPMAFMVEGQLDFEAAQTALTQIVQRHEILRTSYHAVAGTPMQTVHDAEHFSIQFFDVTQLPPEQQLIRAKQIAAEDERNPFALDKDFMIRAGYIQMSPLQHTPRSVLLLNVHHIAFDGWSLGILLQEFSENYQACLRKEPAPREPLAIQYLDFASWQQDNFNEVTLQKQLNYWQEKLAALPESHGLYMPAKASEEKSGKSQFDSQLTVSVTAKMKGLCQQFNTSPFIFIHAVFSILLARHSGRNDIVIGTPVANRQVNQLEPLLGFFVNSLVLRTSYHPEQSFAEYLAYVGKVNLDAQANQDVPFEKLVEHCAQTRSRSHSPLFQIMLSMNSNDSAELPIPGVNIKPLQQPEPGLKFDIKLNVAMTEEHVALKWTFNPELFDVASIQALDGHLHSLFTEVVKDPAAPLHKLPMLSVAEMRQVLAAENISRQSEQHAQSLIELFHRQVVATPEKTALIFEQEKLSYAQLNNYAEQFVCQLNQETQQPYIGICLHRSFELIVAILAIWKIGKAYVPIHPETPETLVQHMITTADLQLVVSTRQLRDAVMGDLCPVLEIALNPDAEQSTVATMADWQYNSDNTRYEASDPAYIIFTSGSTGMPKGVVVEHKGLLNLAVSLQQLIDAEPDSAWGWTASYSFDSSVKGLTQLMLGQPLVIISDSMKMDPELLQSCVQQNAIGILDCTPSLLELWRPLGLQNLPQLIIGGEAINESLWQELAERDEQTPGRKAFNVYGPTECSVNSCWTRIRGTAPHIGQAIPNTLCVVIGQDGNLAPTGAVGELAIAGIGLAREYLQDEALTAAKFIPNPFSDSADFPRLYRTGDLVRRLRNGNFEFIGRVDNQVKIRGYRIELDEIHRRVAECAPVESCLILVDGDNEHKRIVAYVQLHDQQADADQHLIDITQQLSKTLQAYMLPAAWGVVTQWPLTINGKIDKARLPAAQVVSSNETIVLPETETEGVLRHIWSQLLGLPDDLIGVTRSFFELGGHSLLIVRLTAEIRHQLEKEVKVKDIYEHITLRDLAAHVDELTAITQQPRIVPIAREQPHYPVSFTQKRLWFIHQMDPGSAEYNMPMAFDVNGAFCLATASRAMSALIQRHESLRTVFVDVSGEPAQKVLENVDFQLQYRDLTLAGDEQYTRLQEFIRNSRNHQFDLSAELMVRAEYVALVDNGHEKSGVLLFNMHHIASDGWSVDILIREFTELYKQQLSGNPVELPSLPVQYLDYAAWQATHFTSHNMQKQFEYWQKQLDDVPSLHGIALDRPRPAVKAYVGGKVSANLNKNTAQRIAALAQDHQITPFMLMHAALALVISRHSNSSDIVVGTPVANRRFVELEGLIGFFANTLVLRNSTDFTTLSAYLSHIRDTHIQAQDNQDVPFEQLVEKLQIPRSLSHTPLFQILITTQTQTQGAEHAEQRDMTLPDVSLQLRNDPEPIAKFDLHIAWQQHDDGIKVSWIFDTHIFNQAHIEQLSQHLVNTLESMAQMSSASPQQGDAKLSDIVMLSAVEQKSLEAMQAKVTSLQSMPASIQALVEQNAIQAPDKIALNGASGVMTYSELNKTANRLANLLVAEGVCAGDLVGISLSRDLDSVIAILAILKAGAGYVPFDTQLQQQRVAYIAAETGITLSITQRDKASVFTECGVNLCICLDDTDTQKRLTMQASHFTPTRATTHDDIAYVIYTSGSTGNPKGVVQTHGTIVNLVTSCAESQHIFQSLRTLHYTSVSFDVSIQELATSWATVSELVILSDLDKQELHRFGDYLIHTQIERVFVPPAILQMLAEQCIDQQLILSHLREVIVAGEALKLTPEIRAFFVKHHNCVLWNHYGPTETHVVTTHKVLTTNADTQPSLFPPIGQAVANHRLYVLDKQLAPVPAGCIGELYVAGPGVAKGYLNQPTLTDERFILAEEGNTQQRLYKTGDLVRLLDNGVLQFIDRVDQQVKLRGFRIEPGEIEAVINQLEEVRSSLVMLSKEHSSDGQLIAWVQPEQDHAELADEQHTAAFRASVKAHVQAQLPAHLHPGDIVLVAQWPVTINGKIDKKALPKPQWSHVASEIKAPEGSTEIALRRIWAVLLKKEAAVISVEQDFFELGGHSLLTVKMVGKISQEFNKAISVRSVFEHATIRSLAAAIDAQTPLKQADSLHKIPQTGPYLATSFAQQRMWFIDQMQGGSADYNMPMALRISGSFQQSIAIQALAQVTQRHRVLRCIYQQTPEGLKQLDTGQSVPVAFHTLSHLAPQEKQVQLQQLLNRDAGTSFMLDSELPVRVTLVALQDKTETSDAEVALLVNMHHSVSDGISCQILIREFSILYNQMLQQGAPVLPELPVQYSDYAHWQQQKMRNGGFEQSLVYWKNQLNGIPLTHGLELVHPRPERRQAKGERIQQQLTGYEFQQIQAVSRRYNVTPFMLLQGLFALLIARHSNSTDIVVGTPVGNRTQHETESLIGMFVNTIALRVDTHQKTLSDYFAHVKQVHVDGLEHQALPFEQVVDALQIPRSNAFNPIFQIMFTLDTQPEEALGSEVNPVALRDCQIQPLSRDAVVAKFDLDVSCQLKDETLSLNWTYDSCIFNRAQIQRMAGHFENMLSSLLSDAAQYTSGLTMLSPDEMQQLLQRPEKVAASNGRQDYTQNCVHHVFSRIAAQHPDAIAVEFGETQLSYQALEQQSDVLAEYLIRQGVTPHSIVGLYGKRSEQLIIAILAILKAGAAYLPIDPEYPAERIQYMLENSGAQQVLCLMQSINVDVGDIPVLSMETALAWCNDGAANCTQLPHSVSQDTAYVIYTSGSTGQPKGVAVSHNNWCSYAQSISEHYDLGQERVLQSASISFDIFIEDLSASLLSGGTLIIRETDCAMSCRDFWQFVKCQEVSFVSLSTAYWHLLSADAKLAEDTANTPLRTLITGGEEMSAMRLQHWQAHACKHIRLFNTYGPTEATVIATFVDVTRLQPVPERLPIGKPIAAGYTLILDRDKNLVPDGVPGELYLGGATISKGYLNNAPLNNEKFINNPWSKDQQGKIYKTGDLVKRQPDGSIVFLGRIDSQVKVNGFLVEPLEIEAVLCAHKLVSECVVVPQKLTGNWRIYAYVTLQQTTADGKAGKTLASYARSKLPAYMQVDEIIVLDEWPVGVNGKIDKSALPQPQGITADEELLPLANEFEIKLAQIWAQVMGLDTHQIGSNSHFFELGGHSLMAVQLASLLKSEMQVTMPIKALFETPVLSDLAHNLRSQSAADEIVSRYGCMTFSDDPTLPNLFVAPAMGMTGAAYQGYAAQLASALNVHILTTPGIDELVAIDSPLLTLSYEQRIESWFAAIKDKQGSGHYRLAGHSLGGDFAVSLAHRLEQNGDSVEVLLIDAVLGLHAGVYDDKKPPVPDLADQNVGIDSQHQALYQQSCHNQLALVPSVQFKQAVINKISVLMAQQGLATAHNKEAVLQRIQDRSVNKIKQVTCAGDHLSILKHQDVAEQTLLLSEPG